MRQKEPKMVTSDDDSAEHLAGGKLEACGADAVEGELIVGVAGAVCSSLAKRN